MSTNRDRIKCYRCRQYDHFARECSKIITDEDSDQGDLDQEALQMLMQKNPTSSNTHASMECLNM